MSSKVTSLPKGRKGAREWKAARVDRLRSDWPTWPRAPDADIRNGLRVLRARARHEAQNSDHARSFLRAVKSNIVGDRGVRLQSQARLANGRADERSRTALEDSWQAWGELGNCEVTGCLSWVDEQQRMIETVARDGEAIYRLVPWDSRWMFALQAIDPEAIDVEYSESLPNGNVVVMGVEIDRWRRRVAYHVLEEDPLAYSYAHRRNRKRTRLPAEEVLHCFLPEWVWQTRGVPWMATALRRLNDLNGYEESAVVAARAGASKMGFFERGEEAQALINDSGTTEPGVAATQEDPDGQMFDEFSPGSMSVLPYGWKFNGWDPQYPHAEHGNFIKACLRGVASGLGVGYNALANDLEGVNYSSLRQGALTERDLWKTLQRWAIGTFQSRVFGAWMDRALPAGAITANGRPLLQARDAELRRVRWQPRRWQWVDPAKEAAAARDEIAMRTRSISDVIRERGEDPDEVWAEIQREREQLAELGISPEQASAAATATPPPQQPMEDADDEH